MYFECSRNPLVKDMKESCFFFTQYSFIPSLFIYFSLSEFLYFYYCFIIIGSTDFFF